ncbi:MAG: hypothetical protein N5P05_002319 [Chroococcopsis gigantea SAG 12.99]|jgi:diguanylate cyclase (GGDEF)-like protein/PAS domain S-box-containing protein|nr:EAL domain-containing protein [Chlorogloea purpurea SAG 13.99]MDV3000713.1 hypothetical protein [Chroococcopsis gigantea SAG 12.99]
MFHYASDLRLTLSTNATREHSHYPIWLISISTNKVIWANKKALPLLSAIGENNGQDKIAFSEREINELSLKKFLLKKWTYCKENTAATIWGLCSEIIVENERRLILVEGISDRDPNSNGGVKNQDSLRDLISKLLIYFISLPMAQISQGITKALEIIGEYEGIDRSYLFTFDDEQEVTISNNHEWCREGIKPEIDNLQKIPTSLLGWFLNELKKERILHIPDIYHLPPQAEWEKKSFEAQNIKSLLIVAIVYQERVIGFVGFDAVRDYKTWTGESISLLTIVAEMLGNALYRQRTENFIQEQQEKINSLINSLPGIVFTSTIQDDYPMKFLSKGCINLTEYNIEELMRHSSSYNNIVFPEDLDSVNQTIRKAIDAQEFYEVEYRIKTKSGLIKWVWEKGNIVLDKEGNVKEVEGFINDITPLKKTEQALRESEARYRLLAENTTDLISRHLPDGSCIYASSGGTALLGYHSEKLLCSFISEFCHPEDLVSVNKFYSQIQSNQEILDPLIYRMLHQEGYYIWVETCVKLIVNPSNNEVQEFIAVSRNITKRMQTEEALKQAEEQYRSIFEHITQGVFQSTLEGYYLKVNPALAQIYGYDSCEELIDKLRNISQQLYVNKEDRERLIDLLDKEDMVRNFEAQVYRKDGSIIWISESTRKVYNSSGEFLYYEGTVEDITYRRQTEAKLIYDAVHDNLTQSYNRAWFTSQLKIKIRDSQIPNHNEYAVLFIDLDQFKLVNDSFGHLMGDELLKQVCLRLKEVIRQQDKIARFGGDEFVILLNDVKDEEDVIKVVRRIQNSLNFPFQLGEKTIFSSASIGITLSNSSYKNPEDLLRDADIAMYQAKAQGKNSYVVFDPQMYSSLLSRLHLENDLRHAVKNKKLSLYYQPIVNLQTGSLIGFEALVRWYHIEKGWVSPQEFIPIAEETGLINSLGLWVLEQACQQLAHWNSVYPDAAQVVMNVNLSPYQLKETGLVKEFSRIVKRTGVKNQQLKLELTESGFLETINNQSSVIEELESLGVQFCIDDFGTGYSSLSRLHEFPIRTLKIDRSFTNRLESNHTAIVQTILTLAHTLGMDVVAEGIETTLQLEKLKALGCEAGQGFIFSPPVCPSDAAKFFVQTSLLPPEENK